jgi:hypothetical protein
VLEIALPFPHENDLKAECAGRAREIIEMRAKYRDEARSLPTKLQGIELREIEEEPEP